MSKYNELLKYYCYRCERPYECDKKCGSYLTLEEACEKAKKYDDKETPKKRIYVEPTPAISSHYICPICKTKISPICCYCDTCGQKLE